MPYHMAAGGVQENSPCRYVYIARNPKDVVVSYYHFDSSKAWAGGYDGPWEHWREQFTEEQNRRFDAEIEKLLSGSGLEFDFG